jgi:hypothetical protein
VRGRPAQSRPQRRCPACKRSPHVATLLRSFRGPLARQWSPRRGRRAARRARHRHRKSGHPRILRIRSVACCGSGWLRADVLEFRAEGKAVEVDGSAHRRNPGLAHGAVWARLLLLARSSSDDVPKDACAGKRDWSNKGGDRPARCLSGFSAHDVRLAARASDRLPGKPRRPATIAEPKDRASGETSRAMRNRLTTKSADLQVLDGHGWFRTTHLSRVKRLPSRVRRWRFTGSLVITPASRWVVVRRGLLGFIAVLVHRISLWTSGGALVMSASLSSGRDRSEGVPARA